MSVLVAYDASGSTNGDSFYHDITRRIVSELDEGYSVIKWSDTWMDISPQDLEDINIKRRGGGGTFIDNVAKALVLKSFKGKLVLITDGEVDLSSIDMCDDILREYRDISEVDVHVIRHIRGYDLSVSCPFTRYCPHKISYYSQYGEGYSETRDINHNKAPERVDVISREDIELINNIQDIPNVHEFEAAYDGLLRALSARMMGRADVDTEIHDKLVALNKRLVKDVSERKNMGNHENMKVLERALEANDFEECIKAYGDMTRVFYESHAGDDVLKRVQGLLNISKGGLRHNVSHVMRRADAVVGDAKDLDVSEPVEDTREDVFVCPITYDNELDVCVLLKDVAGDDGLLSGEDKNVIDDLYACPLNAFKYSRLCDRLKGALDMSVSVSAVVGNGGVFETSPFTRDKILGALYMGCNESQAAATDRDIARLLTGNTKGKRVGNMSLWYAVFYYLIKDVQHKQDVLGHAVKHLKWRLENTHSTASLSGLPGYFDMRVKLGVACWMIVTCPVLGLEASKDLSRLHVFNLGVLRELVGVSGLYIPDGVMGKLTNHGERLGMLYKMLYKCKRDPEGVLKGLMQALYQRCVRLHNGTYIPIDGDAGQEQKAAVMGEIQSMLGHTGLSVEEVYNIHTMVSPDKSCDAVELKYGDVMLVKELPKGSVSWPGYGLDTETIELHHVICPKTCRGKYAFGDHTWREEAEACYKMQVTGLISVPECFIRYVCKYGKYPECVDDLVTFVWEFYSTRGRKSLPAPIMQFAREVFEDYGDIMKSVDASEFVVQSDRSRIVARRMVLEAGVC